MSGSMPSQRSLRLAFTIKPRGWRRAASCVAAILAIGGVAGAELEAHAADLPGRLSRHDRPPRPLPRRYIIPSTVPPDVYVAPPLPVDPGPPPSEHGYYGYYGFDVAGTPYGGLYSANVQCLRSVATPAGYRTVNICH